MVSTVLAEDADNTEARLLRARVYYYQSRHSQAARDFQSVLDSDAENLEAVIGLYDVELAQGNDATADTSCTGHDHRTRTY